MKVIRYTNKKGKKRLDVKFSKKEWVIMAIIAFGLSEGFLALTSKPLMFNIFAVLFLEGMFLGMEWAFMIDIMKIRADIGKVEVEE